MTIRERLEKTKTRKNFYRDNYRRLLLGLLLCLLVVVTLILIMMYLILHRGESNYYATSSNGELTQLTPVPRGTGLPEIPQ